MKKLEDPDLCFCEIIKVQNPFFKLILTPLPSPFYLFPDSQLAVDCLPLKEICAA